MQENRWQKIEEIFNRAAVLPVAERQTFVEDICRGDQELYREILLLLETDDAENLFLDEPVFALGAQILETEDLLKDSEFAFYRIKKLLGKGGMGAVYLAEDVRLLRLVALKILPSTLGENPESVQRFRQEAQAASAISHPNIAHIYEFGEENNRYFLAMEYVEGKTLREILKENPIDKIRAIEIALQIADALAATHKRGIVHRDIKPENIIVTENNLVKILDFGLAKLNAPPELSEDENRLVSLETTPGIIIGTTAYMSPEQVRAQPLDARTDLWSLGVLLFEMLAGKRPFEGATPSDIQAAILLKDAELLKLPTKSALIVGKLLKKDVDERCKSASDLADDLKNLKNILKSDRKSLTEDADNNTEQSENTAFPTKIKGFWNKQSLSRKAFFLAALIGLMTFGIGISFQFYANSTTKRDWKEKYVVPKNLTPVFYVDYFIEPNPGRRNWFRSESKQWVERQPDGTENVFDEIEETTVEGEKGVRISNIVTYLEIFIPYQDGKGRTAYWRSPPNEKWQFFGEITYLNDSNISTVPNIESLAVLPFQTVGANDEIKLLSEGLAEDLTRNLGSLKTIRVVSFSSAKKMRDVGNLEEIKVRLNIKSLLRGRIEQNGGELSVSVELVNLENGIVFWSKKLNSDANDLLKLRNALTQIITNEFQKLNGDSHLILTDYGTRNNEAFRAYLIGKYADRSNSEGAHRALKNLERAVALDAQYALALDALAGTYNLLGTWFGEKPDHYQPLAEKTLEKALLIDNNLSEAHTTLAKIKMDLHHDWTATEREFLKAIELNPNNALAHHWYGEVFLSAMGRYDESLRELETARQLNPLSSGILTALAWTYLGKKDYQKALELSDEALQLNPQDDSAYSYKSMALMKLGRFDEAAETAKKSSSAGETSELGVIYGLSGKTSEAREMLKRMEKNPNASPYNLAVIYGALGEKDRAFALLEKQLKTNSVDLLSIRPDPLLDSLRDDPRFAEIEKKLNLPK